MPEPACSKRRIRSKLPPGLSRPPVILKTTEPMRADSPRKYGVENYNQPRRSIVEQPIETGRLTGPDGNQCIARFRPNHGSVTFFRRGHKNGHTGCQGQIGDSL
jgi:hypothetical protein